MGFFDLFKTDPAIIHKEEEKDFIYRLLLPILND